MGLRDAKLKMIAGVTGSWEVAAAYLGMTVNALRNRAYEVKGQVLTEDHCLALQALSGTTYYAEAIATVRELLLKEGILAGSSSGTLIATALRWCREQTEPKRVVTFVCDTGA